MAAKGVGGFFIMKTIIILLLILVILPRIVTITTHFEDTIWREKGTDRPIVVIKDNGEDGITYKYAGEPFERYMSLFDLLTKYVYEGDK